MGPLAYTVVQMWTSRVMVKNDGTESISTVVELGTQHVVPVSIRKGGEKGLGKEEVEKEGEGGEHESPTI